MMDASHFAPRRFFGDPRLWLVTTILLFVTGTVVYVQATLLEIEGALPVRVLEQDSDLADINNDMTDLVWSLRFARRDPNSKNVGEVRETVEHISGHLRQLRTAFNFDNIVGASAIHAVVNPAILDIRKWLDEGVQGYPPLSPVRWSSSSNAQPAL